MFFKVTDKQSLKDRNEIFKEVGIPALENKGFLRRPFKTSWFGEYYGGIKGYNYEFARISNKSEIEIIDACVMKGEYWIQIKLNVFELFPKIEEIVQLKNYEGLSFGMPYNSIKEMRLRVDDYKGPPIIHTFSPEHKIGSYYTENGYKKELEKLKSLIKKDMKNIDKFVKRWHELHKPNLVDWEGNIIEKR
jgi:hypothetical protein